MSAAQQILIVGSIAVAWATLCFLACRVVIEQLFRAGINGDMAHLVAVGATATIVTAAFAAGMQ